MKRILFFSLVMALASLAYSVPAKADGLSFGLTGCGNGKLGCPDATYSFDVGKTSATLTIQIAGAIPSGANQITAVDLGFTANNNLFNLGSSVTFVKDGSTVAGIYNNVFENNINSSSNCTSGGTAAFICASSTSGGASIATGDILSWTWTYSLVSRY